MDINKSKTRKCKGELYKNAVFYLEQILKATPDKRGAVWPPTFDFKNHPRKMNNTCTHCRKNNDELTSDVVVWTLTHRHISVGYQQTIRMVYFRGYSSIYGVN